MRVNVYAEEMTNRVEIISKEIDGQTFTGLRFYLELPVTVGGEGQHKSQEGPDVYPPINGKPAQVTGPFIHRPGDDDSSAVTFWGKRDLREVLKKALSMLDAHYGDSTALPGYMQAFQRLKDGTAVIVIEHEKDLIMELCQKEGLSVSVEKVKIVGVDCYKMKLENPNS